MKKIFNFIVNKRIFFLILWSVLLVGSIVMIPLVNINYDTTYYLPETSRTKESLVIMEEEFGLTGQASVMVENVTIEQAIEHKRNLLKINKNKKFANLENGIIMEIVWIDSFIEGDTIINLERWISGQKIIGDFDFGLIPGLNQFYNGNSALFQIVFTESDYSLKVGTALEQIREYFESQNVSYAMSGTAVSTYYTRILTEKEVFKITLYVLPIVLLILIIFTSSWVEPIIFLIVVGASVLINMGTNLVFPSVSFLTNSTASLLQLAISMDYAIFLLHAYTKERDAGMAKTDAMKAAMKKSFTSISASMLTTIAGFIALMFMRYTIGLDLAVVMIKGIVLSLLATFTLLPSLILFSDKLLIKTKHRPFFPDISGIGKYIVKLRYVLPAVVLLGAIPLYNAQNSNKFIYGEAAMSVSEGTGPALEKARIEAKFGRSNMLVVLVPTDENGDFTTERAMIKKLTADLEAKNLNPTVQALSTLIDINTYIDIDGVPIFDYIPPNIEIPDSIKDYITNILTSEDWILDQIPEGFRSQLQSENYSRIIISVDTESESPEAFDAVTTIKNVVDFYYFNENYHILGVSSSVREIKTFVEADFLIVNLLSIALVLVILFATTRSILVPLILVLVIEFSIWVNMSIPFYTSQPLIFIGYMIVSAVQLGATIDYGILFSGHYLEARKTMIRRDAIKHTLQNTAHSILTSALILTTAGYTLKFVSSVEGVASLGELIGRGAALSGFLVLFLLPQLLYLFDKFIEKTTWKAKFYRPVLNNKNGDIIELDSDDDEDAIIEVIPFNQNNEK